MNDVGERWRATPADRLVQIATAALLLTGFWLRAKGYLYRTIPLNLDEVAWAVRLFELPLKEHLIRPLGFMAVAKAFTAVVSRSEAALRFMPWAAGVAAMFLSFVLSKRLFNSPAARLLFVGAIALQPAAIDLAKDFKPYSVGFFLHMCLVWLVLRYVRSGKTSDLIALSAVTLPAVLFTQDIIFAYPAVFLVTAYEALRKDRKRHLIQIVLTALACAGLVLSLYLFIWSQIDMKSEAPYWGTKYDVFYVPGVKGAVSHVRWVFDRYWDITLLPAQRAEQWRAGSQGIKDLIALRTVYQDVWFALHLVGLAMLLLRRRFAEALLLCSPLWVLIALNTLGVFPMGSFRADFFLLAYIAPIAGFALERGKPGASWWDPVPTAVLLVAPLLAFEKDWHSDKSYFCWHANFPAAFRRALAVEPVPGQLGTLALDSRSCSGWNYYSKYQPEFSTQETPLLLQRVRPFCAAEEDTDRKEILAMQRAIAKNPARDAHSFMVVMTDNSNARWAAKSLPAELRSVRTSSMSGRQHVIEVARRAEPTP